MLQLGNSTAGLYIAEPLVIKVGDERLAASADKQRAFMVSGPTNVGIGAPTIYSVTRARGKIVIVMSRVHDATASLWTRDFPKLLNYVRWQYEGAEPRRIPASVFIDKLYAILADIRQNPNAPADMTKIEKRASSYLRDAFAAGATVHINPARPSHGDLTLCNVLSTPDVCMLVDFSAPFLDAPLNDLVKLRQDTKHRWCLALSRELVPGLSLRRMDEQACATLQELPDRDWYRPLAVMNLMRVLPYTREPTTYRHVLKEIDLCTP